MSRRRIGQEALAFDAGSVRRSVLDDLASLIDWSPLDAMPSVAHSAAKGELAWPSPALFKVLLIAVWYDLLDVKLAKALADRASFRRFCGFAAHETQPERAAFVRFRRTLVAQGPDKDLTDAVTRQLNAQAVTEKTGMLVEAAVIASGSRADDEAAWSGHKRCKSIRGFKAHIGAADANSAYRGAFFGSAVRDKGGSPRVVLTGAWGRPGQDTIRKLKAWNYDVNRIRCQLEKICGTWKRSDGLRRIKRKGLAIAALGHLDLSEPADEGQRLLPRALEPVLEIARQVKCGRDGQPAQWAHFLAADGL